MSETDVQREIIKCVFVGDTGVGKTKLICSHVNGCRPKLEQLMTVHIPTVWAMDPQRIYNIVVDGVNVPYRPWDTFGDHNNDRCFAYSNANVVVVCYAVCSKKSLQNIKVKWYPEIKRNCPNASVIVVACKIDLRYLCMDDEFKNLMLKRPRSVNSMKPEDMVYLPEGRALAKELGAFYYETSVLTGVGVDELFQNLIRAAFAKRRRPLLRFHSKPYVTYPMLQRPQLPPKPRSLVQTNVQPRHLYDANLSFILNNDNYANELFDVFFKCGDQTLRANRLVLAACSRTFYDIFISNNCLKSTCSKLFLDLTETKTENGCDRLIFTVNHNHWNAKIFLALLHFLYAGTLSENDFDATKLKSLSEIATILQVNELSVAIEKCKSKQDSYKEWLLFNFVNKRDKMMLKLGLEMGLFVDVTFLLQGNVTISAHKFLLITRCDFMKALLGTNFQEANTSQIKLPDISKNAFMMLTSYLYSDGIYGFCSSMSAMLSCLELSNRFCLKDFHNLLEKEILCKLNKTKNFNLEDMIMLIEFAQLHNATNLCNWCLHYLSCNHILLNENLLLNLSPSNRSYIKLNQWPPSWYFEDSLLYDSVIREKQKTLDEIKKKDRKNKSYNLKNNPVFTLVHHTFVSKNSKNRKML